ncbi:unnamed protein product [marine sediment metagenome]|uniref:Uncharacterized protein n=1 Tax=marine sediment metagenome TaxID=412755 RepID=X1TEM0_9ZZZZ
MAEIPIEIVCVGYHDITPIENAILFLNNLQKAFKYTLIRNKKSEDYEGETKYRYTTSEIYKLFDEIFIKDIQSYLIGVTKRLLDGHSLGNLFGATQLSKRKNLKKGITTLYEIKEIFGEIPIEIYLIFEFLSFSIRFLVGRGLIHDQTLRCVFDRKIEKNEILDGVKRGNFLRRML